MIRPIIFVHAIAPITGIALWPLIAIPIRLRLITRKTVCAHELLPTP